MDNMEQVRLFLEDNNLKLVYNRVVFEAIVTYHDKSTYETGMMKVGIDENNFPKIQLLSSTWDPIKIPLEYSYTYGRFNFNGNDNQLEINNCHYIHGKYFLTIKKQ